MTTYLLETIYLTNKLFERLQYQNNEEKIRHRLRNLKDRHHHLCKQLLNLEKQNVNILSNIIDATIKQQIPEQKDVKVSNEYIENKDENIITEICYREILGLGFTKPNWYTIGAVAYTVSVKN